MGKLVPKIVLYESEQYGKYGIIGISPQMKEVYRRIELVAPTAATVIIFGETGTGKELTAKAIHDNSKRKGHFVAINCSAIPTELFESEIFGYAKGAFTGATYNKPGWFEEASNGTLFLDEITEMPLSMQPKLLRALQERQYSSVGSTRISQLSARIITAASHDLEDLVKTGKFNDGLRYRLDVVDICLPPLRERGGDILLLAEHFLRKYSQANNKRLEMGDSGKRFLYSYNWSGNVRELESLIEKVVILSDDNNGNPAVLERSHFESLLNERLKQHSKKSARANANKKSPIASYQERKMHDDRNSSDGKDTIMQIELPKGYLTGKVSLPTIVEDVTYQFKINSIEQALAKAKGNEKEAARLLGISYKSLYKTMIALGMNRQ